MCKHKTGTPRPKTTQTYPASHMHTYKSGREHTRTDVINPSDPKPKMTKKDNYIAGNALTLPSKSNEHILAL